ncbi:hypothetical protein BG261_07265 [Floricoccus tropicus]|uniref:DUF2812 domain-containing protein n=1 Tax=Floricoccus tropicus TaxID=1859473 RepID=A0A1E8GKA3_9LACT|nr:DUF2812 domain-containing protein [Floricoccus tropicus]OFI48685.1 hypothetical protein BG261_07265 [Floricoccus tropicus]
MTEKKIFKAFLFWNFDKEEKWLNDMSAQGWQLEEVKFSFYYKFYKGKPNEYTYRLDYLNGGKKKNKEYLDFLQSFDVQKVGQYLNWVYLAKENTDNEEEFELFSDNQSRIDYLNKLIRFSIILLVFSILLFLYSLLFRGTKYYKLLFILSIVDILIWVLCYFKLDEKKKILKNENIVSE